MMRKPLNNTLLVIHGPNLNLLGSREVNLYGSSTLGEIDGILKDKAASSGLTLETFQSNIEGEIINKIHFAHAKQVDFIIINPAGLTHTSIILRDAFLAVKIPFIEVHLSNIFKREEFRHQSFLSDIALGVICGLQSKSYESALDYAIHYLTNQSSI